jgi:hypothetical protein
MAYYDNRDGLPMNMSSVEMELNRMRADTMADAGNKLELLIKILNSKKSYLERNIRVDAHVDRILAGKCRFFRAKKLRYLKERLKDKRDRTKSHIRSMETKRIELYNNVIMQREALGITEHSWIEQFYGEGADES